jgi:putative hydrolase of the HAD superfamily
MTSADSSPWTWIAFDAVGTLIVPDPPVARVYWRVGHAHGSNLSETHVGERFRRVFSQLESAEIGTAADWTRTDRLQTSEEHERARWRRVVADVLHDVHQPEACFSALYEHFARSGSWKCFPDVPDALGKLRRAGYRLALASNFDRRLEGLHRDLPGLAAIEDCVISTELGYRKPSLHFFRGLCARLSCPAGEVLLVGDDRVNDVRGGRAAGLAVRRLLREGTACGPEEFATLDELAEVLC